MKIVITGGAGFLGRKLSEALLARGTLAGLEGRGEPVTQITCIDQLEPERPLEGVGYVRGDICDADVLEQAIGDDTASVFHLAAVVSGQAEADFDLGMRVNLDATRALLERFDFRRAFRFSEPLLLQEADLWVMAEGYDEASERLSDLARRFPESGRVRFSLARIEERSEERRVVKECISRWSPYH